MQKTTEELDAAVREWVPELEEIELTQAQLDALDEYSTTLPTGTTVGKQWKRQLYFGGDEWRLSWLLGEYAEEPDQETYPDTIAIIWKRIKVVE